MCAVSKSRVFNEARSRGLPKVSSIVYCCVATLVTGGKGYMNEYIGKDYYSHDPGPFKTLKQSIFEEDQIPGGDPASPTTTHFRCIQPSRL